MEAGGAYDVHKRSRCAHTLLSLTACTLSAIDRFPAIAKLGAACVKCSYLHNSAALELATNARPLSELSFGFRSLPQYRPG